MRCAEAPLYLAGRRVKLADVERDPDLMPLKLAAHERSRTWAQLWEEATRDVRERYDREGEVMLAELGRDFDGYSIRRFLLERGFSEDALELYGLMSFRESNMRVSVVEQLREIVGRAFEDMQEVVGGMDRLPHAFYAQLRSRVRLGCHVVAVEQDADQVTAHYTAPGGATGSVQGDYCICTVPFGVLRHIDFRPALSRGKYRAIRELNYNPSTKILLQVRTRFWERQGIVGGVTVTDLPIRRIVYPSHPPEDGDPRGVLLASYTWGQDAARWGALDARGPHRAGDPRRGEDPPRDPRGVRGRRLLRLVRRSVRRGRVRPVRARPGDGPASAHRAVGGPRALRRRALLAVARLDPGSARVGTPGRRGRPGD